MFHLCFPLVPLNCCIVPRESGILARWKGAEGHAMRPEWGLGVALKGHYYLSGPPCSDLVLLGFSWRPEGGRWIVRATGVPQRHSLY
jgi:hypothetical protein